MKSVTCKQMCLSFNPKNLKILIFLKVMFLHLGNVFRQNFDKTSKRHKCRLCKITVKSKNTISGKIRDE